MSYWIYSYNLHLEFRGKLAVCFKNCGFFPQISKGKNRLLKFCYVPATSAAHNSLLFSFFLLQPFTVLIKQTRQAVCAIKQSIFLDVYGFFYLQEVSIIMMQCALKETGILFGNCLLIECRFNIALGFLRQQDGSFGVFSCCKTIQLSLGMSMGATTLRITIFSITTVGITLQ